MNHDACLLTYEKALYHQGVNVIAGVDEVGRGPLAGPVVAAAVVLPQHVTLDGVTDSKKLSAKKRALYAKQIMEVATSVSMGVATVGEIDDINILQATKLAMKRAIDGLEVVPEHLLIDYLTLEVDIPQTGIVKGDAKSLSIAAASIVAKVARDQMMVELSKQYPVYGFEKNAGYGTNMHRSALNRHGYIEGVHRTSFEPIKSMIFKNGEN
ncbi:MAG: ribonuclease HII [Defluviitaleaceae bacterium]|nr:ribonuclease HII [Defluviitaleaceae bacterium]